MTQSQYLLLATAYLSKMGYRVISQSDQTSQMIKPKSHSCILFIVLFLAGILPAILYAIIEKDKSILLTDLGNSIQATDNRGKTNLVAYTELDKNNFIKLIPGHFPMMTVLISIWLIFLALFFIGLIGSSTTKNSVQISPEEIQQKTVSALVMEISKTQNPNSSIQLPTISNSQSSPIIQPQNNDLGSSRENPIPLNTSKEIGDFSFIITRVVRPADDIVAAGNQFNTKPESTQEYLMIEGSASCLKPANEKCIFLSTDFKAVGNDGNVINLQFVVSGVPGQFDTGETFGGNTKSGRMFFLVPKGDDKVVIFHEDLLFGKPVYFSIK
jgi:hypothetical protein